MTIDGQIERYAGFHNDVSKLNGATNHPSIPALSPEDPDSSQDTQRRTSSITSSPCSSAASSADVTYQTKRAAVDVNTNGVDVSTWLSTVANSPSAHRVNGFPKGEPSPAFETDSVANGYASSLAPTLCPSIAQAGGQASSQTSVNPRRCSNVTKPPTLERSDKGPARFVTSLMHFAAGMIGTIWPLSDSKICSGLSLQRFVEETIRRSRTTYSTLQVALYYLVQLKDKLPRCDFTQEQKKNASREMQCGRRMFLAALILASKYLQDRNYSSKAWSKISGLPAPEINRCELQFLDSINWQLHFPQEKFECWQRIVVRLFAPISYSGSSVAEAMGWPRVMQILDTSVKTDFQAVPYMVPQPFGSTRMVTGHCLPTPPSSMLGSDESDNSDRDDTISTVSSDQDQAWGLQRLRTSPPPAPKVRNLHTPSFTPSTVASSTPSMGSISRCAVSRNLLAGLRQAHCRATQATCPPPVPLQSHRPRCHLAVTSRSSTISLSGSSAANSTTPCVTVSGTARPVDVSLAQASGIQDCPYRAPFAQSQTDLVTPPDSDDEKYPWSTVLPINISSQHHEAAKALALLANNQSSSAEAESTKPKTRSTTNLQSVLTSSFSDPCNRKRSRSQVDSMQDTTRMALQADALSAWTSNEVSTAHDSVDQDCLSGPLKACHLPQRSWAAPRQPILGLGCTQSKRLAANACPIEPDITTANLTAKILRKQLERPRECMQFSR